jgi:hypothetical protein
MEPMLVVYYYQIFHYHLNNSSFNVAFHQLISEITVNYPLKRSYSLA